ncbi:hypothetical protein GNY06_08750 [Elizabethkingia argentiflava]|uniref:Uncharacterized protein n=1 Tax=Elizabethkingia argenteiflava TaxID=2681556 RepID=A0A845PUG2_9FLAO|nr:hypothetical protein [Elizabethkingia argenteiflava]NAW51464.1 hypothetical protein [Elizabethkingia argenteiflava]
MSCSINRNVSIYNLDGVSIGYAKFLFNKTNHIAYYSLGGKKYAGFNFNKVDNKYGKKEIFLIMNNNAGNLIYEGLFKIKNYNLYLYNLSSYQSILKELV